MLLVLLQVAFVVGAGLVAGWSLRTAAASHVPSFGIYVTLLAGIGADAANTFIIFVGDNGTPCGVIEPPHTTCKLSVHQGGVQVPLIISGPGIDTQEADAGACLVLAADGQVVATIEVPAIHTFLMNRRDVFEAVRDFLAERSGDPELDRDILGHCVLRLGRELDEHRATIAVLAAVAPLLGLLGTVLGMIETFDVISIFGTGNSRAMASGISVALVTTQTGLLVAIPGLLMSNRLGRAAEQLRHRLDETRASLERHIAPGKATS